MPWDQVRDLLVMQERLESLFGRSPCGWVPPVDLTEHATHYLMTIELPGLNRADVQLDYSEPVLTVRGTRRGQDCCPERYQQLERGQGPFSRSFRFALPVTADGITADFADGILTVVIPKATAGLKPITVG